MLNRPHYLEKLIAFKDKRVIKVITGIRRCGKSVLLQQYHDYLAQSGIKPEQIILINFESLQYSHLHDYKTFYDYILPLVGKEGRKIYFTGRNPGGCSLGKSCHQFTS